MNDRIFNAVLEMIKELDDRQRAIVVEELTQPKERKIVKLGGSLAQYFPDGAPDFDEIQEVLRAEYRKHQEKLFRQIDGDFGEDGDNKP